MTHEKLITDKQEISSALTELIEKSLRISVSSFSSDVRADLNTTSISVHGLLEKHPHETKFRIFINEGTYTYFDLESIVSLVIHPGNFKDGSKAVIRIKT